MTQKPKNMDDTVVLDDLAEKAIDEFRTRYLRLKRNNLWGKVRMEVSFQSGKAEACDVSDNLMLKR